MKKNTLLLSFFFFITASCCAQSLNMSLLSNWTNSSLPIRSGVRFNDCWGFKKGGHEYAVIGSLEKVHFFDVTNPAAPVNIATFTNGASSLWRDFKTYGNYCYAVCDESTPSAEGLIVFDFSALPTGSITQVHQNNTTFQRTHNIYIDTIAGKLYAPGSNTYNNGMVIFDLVANPASPTVVFSGSLPGGYVHDVHVRNNKMYCSHGNSGMYVYNVTNPASPVLLGTNLEPASGYNHSSWLNPSGTHLIMAEETWGKPLKVLNVSDPTNMSVSSTFISALLPGPFASPYTGSIPHNPFIKNNLCFVAYYHEGIQVYDITNTAAPVKVAYYDTELTNTNYNGYMGAWGVYPYLPSGNIIASDVNNGLFVLSIVPSLLPLKITNFEAQRQAKIIQLDWQTENESNTQLFEIQRSSDGIVFQTLSIQMAQGREKTTQSYSYTDKTPWTGTNYYRLKQVEKDGESHYSKTQTIEYKDNTIAIQFYPNPATDYLTIDFGKNVTTEISYQIEIQDIAGKIVFSTLKTPTNAILDLPLHGLPQGNYVLLIKNKEELVVN
ncbi:MAG: hypothetical protein RLZZ292_3573, partial [Bacteroidota bacterium]